MTIVPDWPRGGGCKRGEALAGHNNNNNCGGGGGAAAAVTVTQ